MGQDLSQRQTDDQIAGSDQCVDANVANSLELRSAIPRHFIMIGANRRRDRCKSIGPQAFNQFGLDAPDQARAVKNQGCVELHQGGAGANLGIGVGAVRDAAHPDDRYSAFGQPIHVPQNLVGECPERPSAQATGFAAPRV